MRPRLITPACVGILAPELAASFYDEVLRELVVALGAALFVGHGLALLRRRRDVERRAVTAGARSAKAKGASRPWRRAARATANWSRCPFARSAAFCALGS